MNNFNLLVAASSLLIASLAHAETGDAKASTPTAAATASEAAQPAQPQLSDNPKMKAEGKRLAALMEKLQKESDPEERRKLMSEAMCPQ